MPEHHQTLSTLREPRPSRGYEPAQPARAVPFLRLRGLWLEEIGFACGGRVRVLAGPGRLVIEPDRG